LGVFGGTFDPPHFGHLALAEWARTELALDRVLFVPAGEPPHKRRGALSATSHRVAMTRLAVRGNPAFAVSTLEARRRGPSYTAETVRVLAAAAPGATLHLLMGADMFATFGTWREPEEIARRAVLVVALRPGSRARRASRWSRRGRGVVWLANPGLEVSSSALRARAASGLGLRYLVPDAVARYAARHRLYGQKPGRGRA
ncbi:MAG TPA: nicotinate-nucleotide adenylyltransferase, partial [Candidatus Eisenbacteria bacterium]